MVHLLLLTKGPPISHRAKIWTGRRDRCVGRPSVESYVAEGKDLVQTLKRQRASANSCIDSGVEGGTSACSAEEAAATLAPRIIVNAA